jgi:penicillin G amidase
VWTLRDAANAAFTPPGAAPRTAVTVMRSAFAATVRQLVGTLHESPDGWTWGALHTRQFPSLTGATALGYGPRSAGGDLWTVNAAEGGLASAIGPSWRMIVQWSAGAEPVAAGIYPGGQSENPASPWYSNLVADWWAGRYLPMPSAGGDGVAIRQRSGPTASASVAATSSGTGNLGGSVSSAGAQPPSGTGNLGRSVSSAGAQPPPGPVVWSLLP